MHQHVAHPPGPEQSQGVIDNLSDTLLNAFARVRKPDERFLVMRENVDKFEDSLSTSERLWNRVRSRTTGKSFPHLSANARSEAERAGTPDSPGEDLTADYHDLAVAVQGLGFLESGITDQLNHFSNTLLEFSALLRHTVSALCLTAISNTSSVFRLRTRSIRSSCIYIPCCLTPMHIELYSN